MLLLILLLVPNSFAQNINELYKESYSKRIKFYPLYYNVLKLTDEQISQFEYVLETYNNKYYSALNNNSADNINVISKAEEKELKKILDSRQKKQYSIIKHLVRLDFKKRLKETDYYKKNPRMSVFGDLNKK